MVERMATLEAAKGQALAGRGLCFLEGGCKSIKMLLSEVLWRLDHREAASAHWKEANYNSDAPKKLPLYLQLWPDDAVFDFNEF